MGRAFGIVALIFGLFSWVLWGIVVHFYFSINNFLDLPISHLTFIIGWILPTIAIIFGIIGLAVGDSKGLAIAGLILGSINVFYALYQYLFLFWKS